MSCENCELSKRCDRQSARIVELTKERDGHRDANISLGVELERAKARIAELEGARAKDSAEMERLRSLVAHVRSLAPNGTRGLGSIALDVFKAVDEFDRVPAAQAEPQAAPKAVTCTCWHSIGSHYRNSDKHECHHGNCPCEAFFQRPAEPQAARLAQVGDEVWYRPFRNMKEREAGRMVKVTKRGKYEFRVEDGRVIHPWESDDAGTWLRDANFGNTWWWSREDEPQDCGGGK